MNCIIPSGCDICQYRVPVRELDVEKHLKKSLYRWPNDSIPVGVNFGLDRLPIWKLDTEKRSKESRDSRKDGVFPPGLNRGYNLAPAREFDAEVLHEEIIDSFLHSFPSGLNRGYNLAPAGKFDAEHCAEKTLDGWPYRARPRCADGRSDLIQNVWNLVDDYTSQGGQSRGKSGKKAQCALNQRRKNAFQDSWNLRCQSVDQLRKAADQIRQHLRDVLNCDFRRIDKAGDQTAQILISVCKAGDQVLPCRLGRGKASGNRFVSL